MDLDESETDEKIYGEPQALTEPFPPLLFHYLLLLFFLEDTGSGKHYRV